jgi:hypothetical protein
MCYRMVCWTSHCAFRQRFDRCRLYTAETPDRFCARSQTATMPRRADASFPLSVASPELLDIDEAPNQQIDTLAFASRGEISETDESHHSHDRLAAVQSACAAQGTKSRGPRRKRHACRQALGCSLRKRGRSGWRGWLPVQSALDCREAYSLSSVPSRPFQSTKLSLELAPEQHARR